MNKETVELAANFIAAVAGTIGGVFTSIKLGKKLFGGNGENTTANA